MHVLLISRSFPCHRAGGLEWHGQDVAEGLLGAGHTVTILTTPPPEGEALTPLPPGAEVTFCGATPGAYDIEFFVELFRRGKGLLRDLAPDVVHAQGFAGVPLLDIVPNGIPLVTTIHGTLWSETPLRRGGSLLEAGAAYKRTIAS